MKIKIPRELKKIAQEIVKTNSNISYWEERESCDMFQEKNIEGGFDSTEKEFTFSYYLNNKEYYFQLSLKMVMDITENKISEINLIRAK